MACIAISAFSGWNDAGEAASGAVDHLLDAWPHRTIARVPAEEFIDFQVNRPGVRLDESGGRVIDWPDTLVSQVDPPRGAPFVVVHGPEPSLHWGTYCTQILQHLRGAGVDSLVSLGALLADAPHSRPLPVTDEVEPTDHEPAPEGGYEGPIGIPTVLARAAVSAGLSTSSIWVQVPHYVSQNTSPKAVLALIRTLQSHLDAPIPLGDLEEDAVAWERGVDELARTDPDVAEYVTRLEQAQDATELPGASGDAIAEEFEQFLRRRDDD